MRGSMSAGEYKTHWSIAVANFQCPSVRGSRVNYSVEFCECFIIALSWKCKKFNCFLNN